MSLKGKNRAFFSYNNYERVGSQFIFKDFEKTKSYHTNFSTSSFKGVSFRATPHNLHLQTKPPSKMLSG